MAGGDESISTLHKYKQRWVPNDTDRSTRTYLGSQVHSKRGHGDARHYDKLWPMLGHMQGQPIPLTGCDGYGLSHGGSRHIMQGT